MNKQQVMTDYLILTMEFIRDNLNSLNWPLMLFFLFRKLILNNIISGLFHWIKAIINSRRTKEESLPKISNFINLEAFKRSILTKRTLIVIIIGLIGIQLNYPLLLIFIICDLMKTLLKNPKLIINFFIVLKKKLKIRRRLLIKKINSRWKNSS